MPKRTYFIDSEQKKLTDTTLDIIELDKAEEGEELHYEKIGVSDLTNASKHAHVGIKEGSNYMWLETLTLTSAGYYYSPSRPIVVASGTQLAIGFLGITANDQCRVNVNGYRVKKE